MIEFLHFLGLERVGWWAIGLSLIGVSFSYWRSGLARHHTIAAAVTGVVMIWGAVSYRLTYDYPGAYASVGISVLVFTAIIPYYGFSLYDEVRRRKAKPTRSRPAMILESDAADRETLDALPLGVIRLSSDCKIEYANTAFAQMLGYSASELLKQHVNSVVPGRFHEGHEDKIQSVIEGRARSTDWRPVFALTKDGEEIKISLKVDSLSVFSIEGDIVGKGIGITELRRG